MEGQIYLDFEVHCTNECRSMLEWFDVARSLDSVAVPLVLSVGRRYHTTDKRVLVSIVHIAIFEMEENMVKYCPNGRQILEEAVVP